MDKMEVIPDKVQDTLKNCKQVFTEQEWIQARESSALLWDQIMRNTFHFYVTDLWDIFRQQKRFISKTG